MSEYSFSWMGEPPEDTQDRSFTYADAPYVSVSGPFSANGWWDVSTENVPGMADEMIRDDDAASAWSTVAYIMTEHGAAEHETDEMVQRAPANLGWCFDSQVGMYAYDKNEEWDG